MAIRLARSVPFLLPALFLVAAGTAFSVARAADAPSPPAPPPASPAPSPADEAAAKAVHAYARLSPRLARGAQPEGDAAFAALAAAGVKSIVSVDGATPDVETAKKYGIRYVHVPFGYDGIPQETLARLVKAFQVLTAEGGTVFVHCHHGKHRGPAACAIARMVIDGVPPEEAVKDLQVAGTDPKYKGLYESVRNFAAPSAEALARVPADLPSVAPVPKTQEAMVLIDATWGRVRDVRAAGWAPPKDHPDVDPAHEARILAEHFRELARRPEVGSEPPAFLQHLAASEKAAWDLTKALEQEAKDAKAAQAAFDRIASSCTACHTQFRDNVHRRGAPAAPK